MVSLVAVCRISDQAVLAQKVDRTKSREDIRSFELGLAELLRKAAELPAGPGWKEMHSVSCPEPQERLLASEDLEADSTEGDHGYVYALADPQALCLMAVGFRSHLLCPERVAHELLDGLVNKVRDVESERRLIKAKPGGLTAKTKRVLREVIRSYSDPEKVNRVREVYEKFDNFKGLVHDSVKKTLEAHLAMEALQTQRQSMSVAAENFLKQSICKRRQGDKQIIKTKVLVASSACAALVLLAAPFVFSQ